MTTLLDRIIMLEDYLKLYIILWLIVSIVEFNTVDYAYD